MYLKEAVFGALTLLYLAGITSATDQEDIRKKVLSSAVLLGQEQQQQNTQEEALFIKKKKQHVEPKLAAVDEEAILLLADPNNNKTQQALFSEATILGRDLGRNQKKRGKHGGGKKKSKEPSDINDDPLQKELGGFGGDDLNIRFSKIVFEDPVDAENHDQLYPLTTAAAADHQLPLTAADYPIDMDMAQWLSQSECPSVVIQENCWECNVPFEKLVGILGGPPTHPSTNSSSPYWSELLHVAKVQAMRKAGKVPPSDIMPLPELWKDFTMEQVAEAVHNEYPGFHQATLISYLLSSGAQVDASIIPQRCKVEFLRGIVMLAEINVWAVGTVGNANFGVKYHVGRARPEEVAYLISEGQLTESDGVPSELMNAIPRGSLQEATSFTAYPEGCPMHPAWPAMHSAASSASLWLAVILDLTESQWCQAKRMDHGVAYARTVAGVHYVSDNIAGLNLGQEIIADKLPEHLAQRYGSDPKIVRDKIESLRFDWNDFSTSDCGML